MKVLPVLGTLAVLIAGQDTKTVVFPPISGNGSSSKAEGKFELQSDMTRAILATLAPPQSPPPPPPPPQPQPQPHPQPQPMMPSDYFFPGKDFSILVALRERDGVV